MSRRKRERFKSLLIAALVAAYAFVVFDATNKLADHAAHLAVVEAELGMAELERDFAADGWKQALKPRPCEPFNLDIWNRGNFNGPYNTYIEE